MTTYTSQFQNIDGKTIAGCEALVGHENFSHTRIMCAIISADHPAI
jgi:hypothetical protein